MYIVYVNPTCIYAYIIEKNYRTDLTTILNKYNETIVTDVSYMYIASVYRIYMRLLYNWFTIII